MVDIVSVGLKVDSSDVKTGTKDLDRFGKQAKKTQTATEKLAKAIKGALIGAIAGLVVSLKKSVGIFAEFEASLHELSAITGAAGKDLEYYKKQSLEMSKATGRSASDVVSAYKLIASAKPDLLESKEALSAVTKEVLTLAKAATLDLETAAISLGSSLNQFGADASEASRFINVLAAGSKLGASEIGDTAEALKMAGAVAKSVGLSFEETNAAIQTLGAVSLKGTMAGTGLRAVLLRLSTQSRDEFNPEIVGLTSALQNLGDANLSTAEKADLFGQEAITSATALISQASAVRELTKNLTGTSIAYEQAATNSDTLNTRLGKMRARWEVMSIVMTERLMPALNGMIDLFANASDRAGKLADVVIDAGIAMGAQFFETGKDVENALNEISKMIKEASDYWGIDGSSSAGLIADAFTNLPANIRAAIKLATIEIAAFVDKTVEYGAAIFDALNPGNWFDGKDMGKELESKIKTIDSARKISIESILKERDAIVKRSEAEVEAAKVSFDAERARGEARAVAIAASTEETRAAEAAAALSAAQAEAAAVAAAAEEDARLEQELNRAIHDEDELERIYEQNQRKLEAEKAYHDELYNISSEFEWNIAGLKKAIKDEEYKDVVAHGLNLLMFASQNSKKMHGIYKAAAIAKTVIDTYTAAQGAYSSLASIPIVGPALGIAAAAAAVVSGMARVKAIQSTSLGSSSVSSGGGSASIGSSTTGTGSATAPITTTQEQPVKHDVSVVVSGGLHSDEDVRNLVARINEIQEDMGQVSLVTS